MSTFVRRRDWILEVADWPVRWSQQAVMFCLREQHLLRLLNIESTCSHRGTSCKNLISGISWKGRAGEPGLVWLSDQDGLGWSWAWSCSICHSPHYSLSSCTPPTHLQAASLLWAFETMGLDLTVLKGPPFSGSERVDFPQLHLPYIWTPHCFPSVPSPCRLLILLPLAVCLWTALGFNDKPITSLLVDLGQGMLPLC